MGGRAVLRLARGPVRAVDDWVGTIYRQGGLRSLARSARSVGSFDNRVIDGMVDGLAGAVRGLGVRLRSLQRGALQESLLLAFAVAAVLIVAFLTLGEMTSRCPRESRDCVPSRVLIFSPLAAALVAVS
jgi:multicomponent Na+:H+ antiporter subunit D